MAMASLAAATAPSLLLLPSRNHPPTLSSHPPRLDNAVFNSIFTDGSRGVSGNSSKKDGKSPPDDSPDLSFFGRFGLSSADPRQPREGMECPEGLKHYETLSVLRPDITEEQRLAFTQRYEEAIITGGGMGVEIFNRGMRPLAYSIQKRYPGGTSEKYFDGLYLLFTYFTKPESQLVLQDKFNSDDDVIRSSSFKIKPVQS
eukprot:c14823_g1_i1 orf=350-952(-)